MPSCQDLPHPLWGQNHPGLIQYQDIIRRKGTDMPPPLILKSTPFLVPADCFNRLRLLQLHTEGPLEFGLPGLPGHRMVLRRHHWQCWSRPLCTLLMTWHDFRIHQREDLGAPVACTLSLHHPYSRTVIHHIHDSLRQHCAATVRLRRITSS
jgi:hypothetical protein